MAVAAARDSILLDLWRYRGHIWRFTLQDLRGRYAGSAMGLLWAFLHPLATLLIYTLVFSRLMSPSVPQVAGGCPLSFPLYLCVGLFPWVALQDAIQRGSGAFVEHAPLLKKLYFPESVFVGKVVCSATVNLVISIALVLALLLASGVSPARAWLAVPLLVFLQQVLAFGLALLGATLHVFFRDIGQLVSIGLQAWFWLTPIVYVASLLPEWVQPALWLNPAYHLIEAYHQVLLTGQWPAPDHLGMLVAFSALFAALARVVFVRLRPDLRDEI